MAPRNGDEGRIARTWYNEAAGRALRTARLNANNATQLAFATKLGQVLGFPLSTNALSGWETGKRTVPTAVLLAAALTTSQSLDSLFGPEPHPEVARWRQSHATALQQALDRGERLEEQVVAVQRQLQQQGRQLASLAARIGDEPRPADPSDFEELVEDVDDLYDRMVEVGRRLNRPWSEPGDDLKADPEKRMRKRISLLQARMLDVRAMLALPRSELTLQGEQDDLGQLRAAVDLMKVEMSDVEVYAQAADPIEQAPRRDSLGRS